MVVHMSHNVCNPCESLLVEKDMTEASLAFDEENLTEDTTKNYLVIQWLRRVGTWGKYVMFLVGVVSTEDVS